MNARKDIGALDVRFELGVRHDTGSDGAGWDWEVPDPGEHDARGLVIAILACVVCWAGLGYYLLA